MLNWILLAVCGISLVWGIARLGIFTLKRAGLTRWNDLIPPLFLVPLALFAVWPYVSFDLVGAGDSYHYALQVADCITQLREGVMPVLVGQSDYGFNGNVHTLRTAPYFTHFAGLLDFVTFQSLSFVAVQNLTVCLTSVLAALAAYFATLRMTDGRRFASWLLAALYVLSPAIAGPLILRDMFATYMTVPWLIIFWHGLIGILQDTDDRPAQLISIGSLGVVWYAHPPVAAWLSLAWCYIQLVKVFRQGGNLAQWRHDLFAAVLLAALCAYIVMSVIYVGPGPESLPNYDVYTFSSEKLLRTLNAEFMPFACGSELAGIQLGLGLWFLFAVAAAIFIFRRCVTGILLILLLAGFMLFLIPVPIISEGLWRILPGKLLIQTTWPTQRICPLLASAIIAAIAFALRQINPVSAARYGAICATLTGLLLWSASETVSLQRDHSGARRSPALQEVIFSPQNLLLTRYSYALFERMPATFSHSWVDPEFESHLLDEAMNLAEDNANAVLSGATAEEFQTINGQITIDYEGPSNHLLVFSFSDPAVSGEITIHGGGISRAYSLPRSGGERAFGTEPNSAKTIPLRFIEPGTHPVTIGSTTPGVSVRSIPFSRSVLPVRLEGQTPFHASIQARTSGYLETPHVYIQGYQATVNGRAATVRPSPNHLAMIPVPAGDNEVVLTHPGPVSLRMAWAISLISFAAWPWITLRTIRKPESITHRNVLSGVRLAWREHKRILLLLVILTGVTVCAALVGNRLWQEYQAYGSLRIQLEFPKQPATPSEPLLTLGRTGAADCIYIQYVDDTHIRIGIDHWSLGGPVSEPFPVDLSRSHILEITVGSLYPPSRWFRRYSPMTNGRQGTSAWRIMLDGQTVFAADLPFYVIRPDEISIGQNNIGCSVASMRFSGGVLSVERFTDKSIPTDGKK